MSIAEYKETGDEDYLTLDDASLLWDETTELADDVFATKAQAFAAGVAWAERNEETR